MLTTQIPSKATPEYLDQVIGNADTGQSSKKTRIYTLGSIFGAMIISALSTDDKTVVGAINELFAIVGVDQIAQSDINNIFD